MDAVFRSSSPLMQTLISGVRRHASQTPRSINRFSAPRNQFDITNALCLVIRAPFSSLYNFLCIFSCIFIEQECVKLPPVSTPTFCRAESHYSSIVNKDLIQPHCLVGRPANECCSLDFISRHYISTNTFRRQQQQQHKQDSLLTLFIYKSQMRLASRYTNAFPDSDLARVQYSCRFVFK